MRKQRTYTAFPQRRDSSAVAYARAHESDATREPIRRPADATPKRGDWQ